MTHTIAYTIRGLLEAGIILQNDLFINSAIEAGSKILDEFKERGIIFGEFDRSWNPKSDYICLTGIAQISIIWLKIYKMTNRKDFLENAIKLNSFLKKIQFMNEKRFLIPKYQKKYISGGIPGSFPIWGRYKPFSYPNWATKFYIDALLLEEEINKERKRE